MKKLRISTFSDRRALVGCALALVLTSTACKAKAKEADPSATSSETDPVATEAPVSTTPEAQREAASEAERALAKEFILRFAKIIEASKSDGWLELQSKAQRERLLEKDAVEQSYAAWVVGTKPVLEAMQSAEFRLEKLPDQRLLLTYDSIQVPNDPEHVYEMHLIVEDGKLLMAEN